MGIPGRGRAYVSGNSNKPMIEDIWDSDIVIYMYTSECSYSTRLNVEWYMNIGWCTYLMSHYISFVYLFCNILDFQYESIAYVTKYNFIISSNSDIIVLSIIAELSIITTNST